MSKGTRSLGSPRVEALLAKLTLEEKVSLCHGASLFALPAIERLGIPEFWMSDGPHGVREELRTDAWGSAGRDDDAATCLPTGTALAATWNPDLARRFGAALGAEARARRKDVILGPGCNILRTPLCGRNFEYFGEDPHLAAELAVAAVEGIQSRGTAACIKHFALNNQELDRGKVDVEVDDRALREIYLPAFEAAVVRGRCLTVMGAYNRYRGQHCCHNRRLLCDILKGEWGFDGFVVSDWSGAHDTMEAALDGLDVEMGNPAWIFERGYLAGPFLTALRDGRVPLAVADDKVRRVLTVMERTGALDAGRPAGAFNTPEHQRTAYDAAAGAVVLLKNEGGLLPLDPARVRRLLVVGDNATRRQAPGGGSSGIKALYEITPLEGLRERLGPAVEIAHEPGYPDREFDLDDIPATTMGVVEAGSGVRGWHAQVWSHARRDVSIAEGRADGVRWPPPFPAAIPPGWKKVVWKGVLEPAADGEATFGLRAAGHATLRFDGEAVLHLRGGLAVTGQTVTRPLARGRPVGIELQWDAPTDSADCALQWRPPGAAPRAGAAGSPADRAVAAAAKADLVLFVGGLNHDYDAEGSDRPDLQLPGGQDALIERLIAANPRTVVVLVAGAPVAMPWADRVPAIVWTGYGGMEAGRALADVLRGAVNPGGKLPYSIPVRLEDTPAHAPGTGTYARDRVEYREGVFVGYRWHDARAIAPRFPFGHGRSYTTFDYADLRIERRGLPAGVLARVRCRVTNTGARAGDEVVQLYVGDERSELPRPPRELKAFRRIRLEPGAAADVAFDLGPDAFRYWHPAHGGWFVEPGWFTISVGASSRDLRLEGRLEIDEAASRPGRRPGPTQTGAAQDDGR